MDVPEADLYKTFPAKAATQNAFSMFGDTAGASGSGLASIGTTATAAAASSSSSASGGIKRKRTDTSSTICDALTQGLSTRVNAIIKKLVTARQKSGAPLAKAISFKFTETDAHAAAKLGHSALTMRCDATHPLHNANDEPSSSDLKAWKAYGADLDAFRDAATKPLMTMRNNPTGKRIVTAAWATHGL